MKSARIAPALVLLAACSQTPDGNPWRSAYVETNGIRLHYWRTGAGSGKPAFVLAHGVTDNGLCWTSLARALEADYDLVLYDARGHGLSDKPASHYALADHVRDLEGLITDLELEHPILMGHSMGGGIVAQFAADHPEVPRAVILEDPAFFPMPESLEDVVAGFRTWLTSLENRTKEQLLRTSGSEHPAWAEAERDAWAESKLQFTPRIVETLRDLPDVAALFPRITAPTLILKADAPPEERRRHIEAAAALPHGTLVHVDGAGHRIHCDKPAETLAVVREFLSGL